MGLWIVVNEYAPEYEPNERNDAEEVKHIRPSTGYVVYNERTQKVCEHVTDLYACNAKSEHYTYMLYFLWIYASYLVNITIETYYMYSVIAVIGTF